MLRTMCSKMIKITSLAAPSQRIQPGAKRLMSSFQRNVIRAYERRIGGPAPMALRRSFVVSASMEDQPIVPKSYPFGPVELLTGLVFDTWDSMTINDLKNNRYEPEKLPTITVASIAALDWTGDLLVIGCFEEGFETTDGKTVIKSEELKALDAALDGALTDIVDTADFKAKPGSCQKIRAGKNAKFVALCGLGPAAKASPTSDWGASAWHSFGAAITAAAKGTKTKSIAVTLADSSSISDDTKVAAAGKIVNGFITGAHEPHRFKSKPPTNGITTIDSLELLFLGGSSNSNAASATIARETALAKGSLFTRYLVEAPPNVCTPTYMAESAALIAQMAPERFTLKVLEKEDCEKLGMGCFLGVSEASSEPPKFIHLKYTPKGEVKKKVAIVGKGLTFDSGGYNLKPSAGSMIELMKFDMGGGGATLGAARAFADIQPEGVEAHFIVASCENMIDGQGLRPGDILVAGDGKTVEINNTDAEGRLALCDALIYVQKQVGVDAIVDVATLTGAVIVALGLDIAGMYASDESMANSLQDASKAAGEKIWRMPLEDSYAEMMKSTIADLKNSGGRWGGSITAAMFLKEFVDTEKVSWAHLDIAGPVWDDKKGGATGYGAQLLAEWAAGQGK